MIKDLVIDKNSAYCKVYIEQAEMVDLGPRYNYYFETLSKDMLMHMIVWHVKDALGGK